MECTCEARCDIAIWLVVEGFPQLPFADREIDAERAGCSPALKIRWVRTTSNQITNEITEVTPKTIEYVGIRASKCKQDVAGVEVAELGGEDQFWQLGTEANGQVQRANEMHTFQPDDRMNAHLAPSRILTVACLDPAGMYSAVSSLEVFALERTVYLAPSFVKIVTAPSFETDLVHPLD